MATLFDDFRGPDLEAAVTGSLLIIPTEMRDSGDGIHTLVQIPKRINVVDGQFSQTGLPPGGYILHSMTLRAADDTPISSVATSNLPTQFSLEDSATPQRLRTVLALTGTAPTPTLMSEIQALIDGAGFITAEVADANYAPVSAALLSAAAAPDTMAVGTITRSTTGAATGFSVVWPDGATGSFTGTESTSFPGAIDSYAVTHVFSGVTKTYTQPTLTRDSSGAVTARPAIVVS